MPRKSLKFVVYRYFKEKESLQLKRVDLRVVFKSQSDQGMKYDRPWNSDNLPCFLFVDRPRSAMTRDGWLCLYEVNRGMILVSLENTF